jgi:cytochrome P450
MFEMFSLKVKSPIDGVPVIPGGSFLMGHLHMLQEPDFQVSIHRFAVEYADEKGRCTFWMGPTTPALSVTRSEDVQTLLKASAHRTVFPLMSLHNDRFFGRRNIGVLTGKEWKSQRSVILKALHGKEYLEHSAEAIVKATRILVDRLQQEDESTEHDIGQLMKMLTLDIFGQSVLHTNFGCCESLQLSRLAQAFEFLASEMIRRIFSRDMLNPASHLYSLPTAANQRHAQERAYLRDYIARLVQERRDLIKNPAAGEQVPQDLLTGLIQCSEEGNDLSEETLSDTLTGLLFAGYETSSVTLTYILYLLSQHPVIEQNCLEEIAAQPSADEFVYLHAVCQETLRLYPPAISTTRTLERNMDLDDIHVPKGTYLYFPIWVIQRAEYNFSDPLQFIPERWVKKVQRGKWEPRNTGNDDGDGSNDVPAGNPQAFVAFSAGARSCAGQRFAMQEVVLALSVLLSYYHFEPPKDYVLKPHRDGFVQCPEGGIPMKIVKRK